MSELYYSIDVSLTKTFTVLSVVIQLSIIEAILMLIDNGTNKTFIYYFDI